MTEFKKGDKVTVREGATSIGGQARDPKEVRTVRTVWDDGRVGLYPVQPAAPGNVFESEDLVPHVEPAPAEDHGTGDGSASDICAAPGCNCDLERRFPAPLDPAKVAVTLKGGDYIEAESDGAKVGGKVSHVTERGLVAIEHLGEFAIHHITAPSTRGGYRMFALTDHQPAPEQEPAPGYYTVHPTANPGAVWTGLVFEDGSFVGEEDGFYRSASKGEFSASERLVMSDRGPLLVEWAAEVDDIGTKEIYDTEEEARTEARRSGLRLFRIEWTEVDA
jgi:hypothetical protein